MKAEHVTTEPNEFNTDGFALTFYLPRGTHVGEAELWLRAANQNDYDVPCWVDFEDRFFEVVRTKKQPFKDLTRFQAHPAY